MKGTIPSWLNSCSRENSIDLCKLNSIKYCIEGCKLVTGMYAVPLYFKKRNTGCGSIKVLHIKII
jgi:hypothetical protein